MFCCKIWNKNYDELKHNPSVSSNVPPLVAFLCITTAFIHPLLHNIATESEALQFGPSVRPVCSSPLLCCHFLRPPQVSPGSLVGAVDASQWDYVVTKVPNHWGSFSKVFWCRYFEICVWETTSLGTKSMIRSGFTIYFNYKNIKKDLRIRKITISHRWKYPGPN